MRRPATEEGPHDAIPATRARVPRAAARAAARARAPRCLAAEAPAAAGNAAQQAEQADVDQLARRTRREPHQRQRLADARGAVLVEGGQNTFGRAPGNALILDNAALADTAGILRASAAAGCASSPAPGAASRTAAHRSTLALATDASGEATVLESGALRFFVIERGGKLGVRVRDLKNPHRLGFRGLEYFPVSTTGCSMRASSPTRR